MVVGLRLGGRLGGRWGVGGRGGSIGRAGCRGRSWAVGRGRRVPRLRPAAGPPVSAPVVGSVAGGRDRGGGEFEGPAGGERLGWDRARPSGWRRVWLRVHGSCQRIPSPRWVPARSQAVSPTVDGDGACRCRSPRLGSRWRWGRSSSQPGRSRSGSVQVRPSGCGRVSLRVHSSCQRIPSPRWVSARSQAVSPELMVMSASSAGSAGVAGPLVADAGTGAAAGTEAGMSGGGLVTTARGWASAGRTESGLGPVVVVVTPIRTMPATRRWATAWTGPVKRTAAGGSRGFRPAGGVGELPCDADGEEGPQRPDSDRDEPEDGVVVERTGDEVTEQASLRLSAAAGVTSRFG